MPVACLQIDAFSDEPFVGNPAAVCLLEEEHDTPWMQSVAAEMNLSETAFVRPAGDVYNLRWFTPTVEVDLCGHATLAAAHALWSEGYESDETPIRFDTRSGELRAERQGDLIELDFPSTAPVAADLEQAQVERLADALGVEPVQVLQSEFDLLITVDSAAALRAAKPDFGRLAELAYRGVIVTSESDDSRYDFLSRFFGPAVGVDEDPVTGSAHCCLGPYWGERLGKDTMTAYQASARGGVVRVRVAGDRIFLGGHAVTVFRGELTRVATL